LIDATTGAHVWAETYDRELRDIFAVQDEITQAVVASMHPRLEQLEQERVAHHDPQSLDAWDCVMRGWWHWNQFTKEHNLTARDFFTRASQLDAHSCDAFAGIVYTHYYDLLESWTESVPESIEAITHAARRSIELDPSNPAAQLSSVISCRLSGLRDDMVAAARRAVELNPSYSRAYSVLAGTLATAGHPQEALEKVEMGIRLSPRDPGMWLFYQAASFAHFAAGRYEEAVHWGKRTVRENPSMAANWLGLASAYSQLGQPEEAQSAFEEAMRLQKGQSQVKAQAVLAAAEPGFRERFIEGVRKAATKG
jgi:adenylate cyclase